MEQQKNILKNKKNMKTLEEVREHLKLHFYNVKDVDKIIEFLEKKHFLYNGLFLEFSTRRRSLLDTFESFADFVSWFNFRTTIRNIMWESCDELIKMYESIATDVLHKDVANSFDGCIDFTNLRSILKKEVEEESENVFIKNKDGKLYKYQGGIRRELEQELTDRITLLDLISSMSIKNKDEDYLDYLREEMEEINSKLLELDEE